MKRLWGVFLWALCLLLPAHLAAQAGPGVITTFAGTGREGFSGDGGPAVQAQLDGPVGVAVDAKGNVYIADSHNLRIRRVGPDGIIMTFAGTGTPGFSGDGGPAAQAQLGIVWGLAVDAKGNVYIAIEESYRVRRVGPDGIITSFAYEGSPSSVAVDAKGNVYIAERLGFRIRRVGSDGIITTIAENITRGLGDRGASDVLFGVADVAVDAKGNVYIAAPDNSRVLRVGSDGIVTTIAGTGTPGFSGDGGPAVQAQLNHPYGVAVDANGNIYITDRGNHRIRRVGSDGIITTIAGTGTPGFSGDGGPATQAQLAAPWGVAADTKGNVYIADTGNHRIRRVGPDGIITTFAGTRGSGDGGPAIQAQLNYPSGVAVDAQGDIYIADTFDQRIRRVGPGGIITAFAGTGKKDAAGYGSFSGDGGQATKADLNNPSGAAVDAQGNIYIADTGNHRIRRVSPDGIITTIAGTGTLGFSGDGGPATQAQLDRPFGVAVDTKGNVYIADTNNQRVRRVGPDGIIITIAGTGNPNFSGGGGPATQASLQSPTGVAVDANGNIYIADKGNDRIRRVGPDGIIITIAGTGTGLLAAGFSGDGGPANQARLNNPSGVAVDVRGNVYIADSGNHRIRRVDPDGIITTVAGTGAFGFSGDGGSATQAQLNFPQGVAVDIQGNIYIADSVNHRIRRVEGVATPVPARHRATVVATVTRDGKPAAGLAVAFSRSVSGRPPDYKWKGTTDADGRVRVEIVADAGQSGRTGVTGYYLARAIHPASGAVVGEWRSIPINGGKEITLTLPVGGQARIEGQSPLQDSVPFTLYPNYPNPFNPATQIAYELPETGEVSLKVYNLLGQQVRVLVQGRQEAGYYRVTWDGKDGDGRSVSSGTYLYRFVSRGGVQTRRMLLLK